MSGRRLVRRRIAVRVGAPALALAVAVGACSPLADLTLPSLPPVAGQTVSPEMASSGPGGSSPPDASASAAPVSQAERVLAVLAAFREWAADDSRSYRVAFSGVDRHSTAILDVNGSLLVDGSDVALKATFDHAGVPRRRAEYRRVGGKDWYRFDGGAWRSMTAVAAADMVDPFRGARDESEVRYLGPVDGKDGQFRVQVSGIYLHPVLIPYSTVTAETIRTGKLTLTIREDGTPMKGTWNMHGSGRVRGQLQAISIDLDLVYSRIGQPVTVEAP